MLGAKVAAEGFPCLWTQLQAVADADETAWSPDVSSNRGDDHFAFSAAGTAFFVVGLHPRASRIARRADVPILVSNLHEQFEAIPVSGDYSRMRDTIRRRDRQLQGSINPMLADHGEVSEARQYSGRALGPGWLAPFVGAREPVAELGSGGEHPHEGTCPRQPPRRIALPRQGFRSRSSPRGGGTVIRPDRRLPPDVGPRPRPP